MGGSEVGCGKRLVEQNETASVWKRMAVGESEHKGRRMGKKKDSEEGVRWRRKEVQRDDGGSDEEEEKN